MVTRIRHSMTIAAGNPLHLASFEMRRYRPLALDIAAQVHIANRYHQMGAVVMVLGYDRAGLEFNFGDAHSVLYKKDVFRSPLQDVQAAFFIPLGRRCLVSGVILKQFHRDGAKRCGREVAREMRKTSRRKSRLAVLHLEYYRRFSLDFI